MTDQADEQTDQPLGAQMLQRWRSFVLVWVAVGIVVIVGRLSPIDPVRDFFNSFNWLTKEALNIAEQLFEDYGYWTVFFAPMAENTLFIGALIPGTIVMLLAGLSAHDGLISFWPAVGLATCGAIIGDTISYGIGRFGWQRLGPEARLVRWSERMREPLLNHSIWLVLSYHFAGYSRLVGPAAAGFIRMPLLRWMLLDYIGVAIWVVVFLSGGYALGEWGGLTLEQSDRNVQIFEFILFAFFIIAIFTIVRAANRQRREREAAADPSQDGHLAEEPAPEPAERVH